MLPWILLDTAQIPGGEDKLRLMRRGAEFSIMLNDIELMNSRVGGSEEALATLSCERVSARGETRILIGGLGWASPCGRLSPFSGRRRSSSSPSSFRRWSHGRAAPWRKFLAPV